MNDYFTSVNPFTQSEVAVYHAMSDEVIHASINHATEAFSQWSRIPVQSRASLVAGLAIILRERVDVLAQMASVEMGKPISEAVAEVQKCAIACEYYAEHAIDFLKPEIVQTEVTYSAVHSDPLGVLLAIMPWNYPYWQVIRCVIPAICAGNVVLLKHAPNVFGCAELIVQAMYDANIPRHVVQSLVIHHSKVEGILQHPSVHAVSLTGSEAAGASVASIAGKCIKKCVLELGGSNAFVVWDDADIAKAAKAAIVARMSNNGQSCLAAKRFIVHKDVSAEFTEYVMDGVRNLTVGDPIDLQTQIGPLARVDLAEKLEQQMMASVEAGAVLLYGGTRHQALFYPSVLTNVVPGMPAFDQETFGPLASITIAETNEHAINLAMSTRYGLGLAIYTANIEAALQAGSKAADGMVTINAIVKSDVRLPFGGTRSSGYGRELSKDGIMEFVNRKTVVIQHQPA